MRRIHLVLFVLLFVPALAFANRLADLIKKGDVEGLRAYLKMPAALAEINEVIEGGLTPLQLADQLGDPRIIALLLPYANTSVLKPHSYVRDLSLRRNPSEDQRASLTRRRATQGAATAPVPIAPQRAAAAATLVVTGGFENLLARQNDTVPAAAVDQRAAPAAVENFDWESLN